MRSNRRAYPEQLLVCGIACLTYRAIWADDSIVGDTIEIKGRNTI